MVYKAVNTKFELVSKDYYKDELRYQDRIDGKQNANKLGNIRVSQNADELLLALPNEMKGIKVEGEAWFYCKTDATKDRKIMLQVDENGQQHILKNKISKGRYELKLNWQTTSEKYYTEQNVTVN
jgi:hypothetical protein